MVFGHGADGMRVHRGIRIDTDLNKKDHNEDLPTIESWLAPHSNHQNVKEAIKYGYKAMLGP
jgi:hypothetical protein